MSEFKGTKGKWEARLKGQITSSVYCDNTQICLRAKSTTEAKADILLISKAPEMLEMLESFVNDFDSGLIEDFSIPRNRFQQLIEEATEL